MKSFTFFKLTDANAIPGFEIEPFENEDQARGYAHTLLKNSGYRAIEIWDGKNSIEIEREGNTPAS